MRKSFLLAQYEKNDCCAKSTALAIVKILEAEKVKCSISDGHVLALSKCLQRIQLSTKKCKGGRQLVLLKEKLAAQFFNWPVVADVNSVPLVSSSEYNRVRCKVACLSAKLHQSQKSSVVRNPSERTRRRVKQKLRAEGKRYGLDVTFGSADENVSVSPEAISNALDDSNISLRKYQKLRTCLKNTPSLYSVQKERSSQNIQVDKDIQALENGTCRTIESIIQLVQPETLRDGVIRVKFSADGANVGKFRTFTNFTITFVDELDPKIRGPHLVAIVELCEKYANVREVLRKFDDEIGRLKREPIVVCGSPRNVQVVFCADYKFLLIALGMKAATSSNACVYCKCKSGDYFRGPSVPRNSIRCGDPGTKLDNMMPNCDPEDIVVDVLHMYFRVSDRLFHRLVEQEVADDVPSRAALHAALDALGLKGHLVCNDGGALEFSSLQSRDRDKLIDAVVRGDFLQKVMLRASAARVHMVRALFAKFDKVMDIAKNSADRELVQLECGTFLNMFLAMYQKNMVTPYMHILAYHTADLVQKHGVLSVFNQQAVEKENHHVTSTFFACTNFRGGSRHILRKSGRRLLRL